MVGEAAKRELLGEFPNQIIRASAGTGKTFELSNRYLKLLASGAECQTILATTFTRKGAGEILDRIMERLSDAALDEAKASKLSEEMDFVVTRSRAAKILSELLGNLHRLEISTLDSFFNRVAKAFALELRLPPTWEIVDEQQIARMEDEAIQSVLRQSSVINLLHMLTKGEASRRVASMVRDTVRNIYLAYRESGPGPWDKIPAVGQFLPNEELEMTLAHIENLEPEKKNIKKHWDSKVKPAALTEDWTEFVATTSFQSFLDGVNKFSRSKLPPEIIAIYEKLKPHCAAYFSQKLIAQNHSTRDLLNEFGELLEKAKDETGALRFDDVTERLVQFVSMWDTERFSFRLDNQIQHLLLDEFQDTSLAQWDVIRPFAKAVTSNAETLRSFFCVGDMKQAIFGWRGGVAEIFDLVDEELPNLEETAKRTASYRSSPKIIDIVNEVFANVDKYECDKEIFNEAIYDWGRDWFESHTTNRADLAGYVTVEMAGDCSEQQKRFEETKDSVRNRKVLEKTIARIKEILKTTPSHHSIGVIVRTNKEVSELIGKLQKRHIPASEEGGVSLTDSAAVELILSAITLADHPGDSAARFHVSHSPLATRFGLKPETVVTQRENVAAAKVSAAALRAELISSGYGQTVESLARLLLDSCTERETLRLQHLVRVAYDNPSEDAKWELRPSRFVEYVRNEVKVSDQSSARVRVMTIHKCKGLEFDVVVLPMKLRTSGWAGLTPNVVVGRDGATSPIKVATRYANENVRKLLPADFQNLFDQERQRNVREAMCVLYVGMTRAVHAMHIVLSHGAKPDHKSPSGILLATLCPEAERSEGVLFEHGDDRWYEKSEVVVEPDPFDLTAFYLPETAKLTPGAISKKVRSGRGLPRTSPSRLEGGNEMVLGSIFERHDNHEAVTRGSMIHGCFQLATWLDEAIPDREDLARHLRRIDPTIEDFSAFIDEFYLMIKQDNVRNLLSRSTYQESYLLEFAQPGEIMHEANRLKVQTERHFAVQADEGMLEGVIDRLVLVYQGDDIVAADIIDFKTDEVDGDNLHSKIEYYSPQLTGYRDAVSKFARIPQAKISTRLVFVTTGQVVNLDLIETSSDNRVKKHVSNSRTRSSQPKQDFQPKQSVKQGRTKTLAQTRSAENKPKSTPAMKKNSKAKQTQSSKIPEPKFKSKSSKQQKTLWDD